MDPFSLASTFCRGEPLSFWSPLAFFFSRFVFESLSSVQPYFAWPRGPPLQSVLFPVCPGFSLWPLFHVSVCPSVSLPLLLVRLERFICCLACDRIEIFEVFFYPQTAGGVPFFLFPSTALFPLLLEFKTRVRSLFTTSCYSHDVDNNPSVYFLRPVHRMGSSFSYFYLPPQWG